MKKIIATVLAMVMALALCTTAFAADTWTLYNTTANNPTAADKNSAAIAHKDAKDIINGKAGNVEYWVASWDENGATQNSYWVTCDKADANHTLYKNNGFYAYVKMVANEAATQYTKVLTAQDKTTDKASCTAPHYLVDGYLDSLKNFYVKSENGSITAKISGTEKLVKVDVVSDSNDQVIYASHVLGKATKNTDKGWDEATCLVCGAKVALTSNKDVLKKNSIKTDDCNPYSDVAARAVIVDNGKTGKYAFAVGTEFAGKYDYAWEIAAGTTGTTTGTTSTSSSPKTFDAGIAMYVGMALTSVAGSAVVIGKKKEF